MELGLAEKQMGNRNEQCEHEHQLVEGREGQDRQRLRLLLLLLLLRLLVLLRRLLLLQKER